MTAPAQTPSPEALAGFADPAAIGGTRPAVRDLVGRVVVIRPTRYEANAPGIKPGTTQERITADLLIVTGGPLEFGGNLITSNKPNTFRVATPYLATGVYVSNTNIVASVREQTGKGVVLGRIAVGITNTPGNNAPYNLLKVDPTEPEYAQAAALYTQVINQQFLNPTPVTIGAVVAPSAPAHVQAAQVNVATDFAAMQHAQAQAAAVDPNAAFAAWLVSQQQAAPAAAPSLPPAPEGWNPEVWAGLTDAQRKQVLEQKPF